MFRCLQSQQLYCVRRLSRHPTAWKRVSSLSNTAPTRVTAVRCFHAAPGVLQAGSEGTGGGAAATDATAAAAAASSTSAAAAAAAAAAGVVAPTTQQLRTLVFTSAVPMVGFGFMDNLVMIQAGDMIDSTIGVTLGLSTLTAAAFGQVFSDVSGVCFGGVVDSAVAKLGLPVSNLSAPQRALPAARLSITAGSVVGVIIGCLLGMTSLLFMDLDKAERAKREAELDTMFQTIIAEGTKVLHCEKCTLWMVDEEADELWSKVFDSHVMTDAEGPKDSPVHHGPSSKHRVRIPMSSGVAGYVVRTGEVVSIPDAYADTRFNAAVDKQTGYRTRSIMAAPVVYNGKVVGLVQALNRREMPEKPENSDEYNGKVVGLVEALTRRATPAKPVSGGEVKEEAAAVSQPPRTADRRPMPTVIPFDDADVRLIKMLATHVAVFMQHVGNVTAE